MWACFAVQYWTLDTQAGKGTKSITRDHQWYHTFNKWTGFHTPEQNSVYIMKWKVKTLPPLLVILFPTVYQVIQYIYRLLPKCFKHLNFAFPCIKKNYILITRESFWILFSSKSPFLMVSWYCQFLLSGLGIIGEKKGVRTKNMIYTKALNISVVNVIKIYRIQLVCQKQPLGTVTYLLVSTISFTLSILQCNRPAAINLESSLKKKKVG